MLIVIVTARNGDAQQVERGMFVAHPERFIEASNPVELFRIRTETFLKLLGKLPQAQARLYEQKKEATLVSIKYAA